MRVRSRAMAVRTLAKDHHRVTESQSNTGFNSAGHPPNWTVRSPLRSRGIHAATRTLLTPLPRSLGAEANSIEAP